MAVTPVQCLPFRRTTFQSLNRFTAVSSRDVAVVGEQADGGAAEFCLLTFHLLQLLLPFHLTTPPICVGCGGVVFWVGERQDHGSFVVLCLFEG